MAEMLERQPPEVQGLLLRTSVLDRVNGDQDIEKVEQAILDAVTQRATAAGER